MVLLVFYGIVVTIPWIIILLKKDLANGLFIWLLLALISKVFGQLILSTLPDISFYRMMWILLFSTFLAQIALKKRVLLPITNVEIAMVLFCVICLVSMVRVGTFYKTGEGLTIRDFLNGYAIPFSIFFLAKNIMDNEKRIKRLFQVLSIIGIYLAVTGIFEHFNLTALVFPPSIMNPSIGIHFGRARGPFLQGAVNGTALGMSFIAGIYLVTNMRKGVSKIFCIFLISLIPIAIFFTYTRACWLGFILSMFTVALFYPKLRKIFCLVFFIIVCIVILNWPQVKSEDRNVGGVTAMKPVYDRINLYGTSLRMFVDKPLFGCGFGNFRKASPTYVHRIRGIPYRDVTLLSTHDTLVGILVELGLVGFIPLLLILFYIFKHTVRLYHNLFLGPFLGKGLVAAFWGISTVFLVNMQFIEMRYFLFPNSLFFLLAGIIVGMSQRNLLSKQKLEPAT